MTKKTIAYVAVTALFSLAILPGAILDIIQPELVVTTMAKIGLPLYVLTLVGTWKLLGVVALATPKRARLNEWAYAGFFFNLTGAAFVHAAGGDTAGAPIPLVFLVLLVASYLLRSSVATETVTAQPRATALGQAA